MKIYDPKITVLESNELLADFVANKIIASVIANPYICLSLPTGKTPELIYKQIVKKHIQESVSFSGVKIFNLDEYWPIDPESPDSYSHYMKKHLIDHIDINKHNWHIPSGLASNPQVEAERFESLIQKLGVDVAYLGLGPKLTCHIGFNEPGSSFYSKTRLVNLTQETINTNRKNFINQNNFTNTAISQGLGTIMNAKSVVMVVTGEHKAEGVKRFIKGEVGERAPATVLKLHSDVEVILDQAAARLL